MPKLSPIKPEYIEKFLQRNEAILEIGSGSGETYSYLKNLGFNIIGTDKKTVDDRLIRCDAEKLPFSDGCFDFVLMECVFSLCDSKKCAEEAFRILKKGGRLLTTDLFSSSISMLPDNIDGIGNLYSKEEYESFFTMFKLDAFELHTDDMIDMMCETVLNEDNCISLKSIKQLSLIKPEYGLWLFKKN